MPHESARGVFYPGVLVILAGVYLARGITWWASPTPGRAAGIDWVSGWMSTGVVAALWFLTAAAALLGVVLAARTRRRTLLIIAGMVPVVIPMIISLYFFASTAIWYFDPDPMNPPTPVDWRDQGSQQGWVTGVEYLAWSLMALWGLLVHTGAVRMLARVGRAAHRGVQEEVTHGDQ